MARRKLTIVDLQPLRQKHLGVKPLQQRHKGYRCANAKDEVVIEHLLLLGVGEVDHISIRWQSKDVDAVDLEGPGGHLSYRSAAQVLLVRSLSPFPVRGVLSNINRFVGRMQ